MGRIYSRRFFESQNIPIQKSYHAKMGLIFMVAPRLECQEVDVPGLPLAMQQLNPAFLAHMSV